MSDERRLLLIGAGGFIGAHLAAAARSVGFEVVAAGRHPSGDVPGCDLLDSASVSACVEAARPDLILNAAGSASVGRSWGHPAETFAVNATGVLHLLEAVARKAPAAHVLCLSSADVYGVREESELPLGEELALRPVTPYGASKAAMEVLCGQYRDGRGMRIGIARLFNLIGPGQSPQFAVPGFARRIAVAEQAGEAAVELSLGNASARRDFVDVSEGAQALVELSRLELCGTYNLCSGQGATIAELVEELVSQARLPVTVRHDPGLERPVDPPVLIGDPARLREATGFRAGTPLARSLGDALDSWRADAASA